VGVVATTVSAPATGQRIERPINVKYVDRTKWRLFVAAAIARGLTVGELLNIVVEEWLHKEHSR
jgi:hypothetical protein